MAAKLTAKEKNAIIEMRRKGATITCIVSEFGHTPATIKKALDEWGVVPEKKEKRHNAASKRTKKKVKSFPSIDDCARRATELGMSYGTYVNSDQYRKDIFAGRI